MTDPSEPLADAENGPADPALLRRIMARVETLPLRYAPFYTRLAELFDLSEPEIEALLSRARDEAAWQSSLLPGVRRFPVSAGPRLGGAEVHLMRFASGLRFPKHRHRGAETLFVLEGAYVDASDGRRVCAGERQDMASDTEHALLVEKGAACVAAVISRGADFTGPVLGPLHRLFAWFARSR
jgi:anti-sigma factor ChrR (cupin superfamily)